LAAALREPTAQAAVDRLIRQANVAGGADNATAVLVREAMVPAPVVAASPSEALGMGLLRARLVLAAWIGVLALVVLLIIVALSSHGAARAPTTPHATIAATVPAGPLLNTEQATITIKSQISMATSVLPAAGTVPSGETLECEPGWRPAELKNPGGPVANEKTYLYRDRSQQSAYPGDEKLLDSDESICVSPNPKPGLPTGKRAKGSSTINNLWYSATDGTKRGWVICPYVFFTDNNAWATCN
jgi:hypothetical protein